MIKREMGEMLFTVSLLVLAVITIAASCGCGATALEKHKQGAVAFGGLCHGGMEMLKEMARPRYEACSITWDDSERRQACANEVTREFHDAAMAVDACRSSAGAYAQGVVAAENGGTADLIALAAAVAEAYERMAAIVAEATSSGGEAP